MKQFNIFYDGIGNINPSGEIEIQRFLELIKIDSPLLKKIREEKDKDKKNELKAKLSYVTFSGTFTKRGNENLIKSSGLCHLDIDGIDTQEDLQKAKEKVKKDKFTHGSFVSPSGKGLKIVVKIPPVKNNDEYKESWLAVAKHYGFKKFNDKSIKDIARACYLSYDAHPFFNKNSEVFTDKIVEDVDETLGENTNNKEKDTSGSGLEYRRVIALLRSGKSKEEIYKDLQNYRKWASSDDKYKNYTFEKAKKYVEKENGGKRKSEAEVLLENPVPEFKSLGIGIHTNKDGEEYFYIGTKVYRGTKGTDGIVRSSKDIKINFYPLGDKDNPLPNEIKREGINYRYPFISEVLDYTWSNNKTPYSIKEFCFGKNKKVSLEECYKDTYKNFKKFMDYQDENMYISKSCDILKSFFLPCFEAMGRTFDNAEKGSGKTRTALLYDLQMFNPIMSADISKASMFRIIEGTSASLIIDDFDAINDEQKLEQTQIIRTGYKRGLKTIRSGKDRGFTPEPFNIFNSMLINNVGGLDEITQDRCNTYYLIKSTNKKIQDKKIKPSDYKWKLERDKKYYSAMLHWKKVKKTYENLEVAGLSGRELEKIASILTIGKLVLDKKKYDNLVSYELNKLEQEKDKDVSGDWLFIALKHIVEILNLKTDVEKENGFWLRLDELVKVIMQQNYASLDDKNFNRTKHAISVYLGKVFRNTPLFKSGKVHGGFVKYELKGKNVKKFIDIRNYTKYFIKEELESLSIQSIQSIQPNLSIQSIQSNKIKENNKNTHKNDINGEVGEVGEVGSKSPFEKNNSKKTPIQREMNFSHLKMGEILE